MGNKTVGGSFWSENHSHQEISINFFQVGAHFVSKVKPDRLRNSKLVEFQVRSGLCKPLLYFIGILNFLPSSPFPSPPSPSCRPACQSIFQNYFKLKLCSNKVSVVTLYNFSSLDWGKACHTRLHLDIPTWRWAVWCLAGAGLSLSLTCQLQAA